MILRDHTGAVISASCRFIPRCTNALEAEMAALMEGVTLAMERSPDRLIVETDCSTAAHMVRDTETNRAPVAAMVEDIKQILAVRPHEIAVIKREQNKASHALAATVGVPPPLRARRLLQYAWLGLSMRDIVNLVLTDLPP